MKKALVTAGFVLACLVLFSGISVGDPPEGDEAGPQDRQGPPDERADNPPRGEREGRRPPHGRPPHPPHPLEEALDADRDGEISADEMKNAAQALAKLDKNENGKLDREELRPPHPPHDRAGRGRGRRGPREEGFRGRPGPRDRDRGGRGDRGRRGRGPREGERGRRGRGPEDRGPRDRGPEDRGPGRGDRDEARNERLMKFDKDGDGKLSQEEFLSHAKAMFEKADENGDGKLDDRETREMHRHAGPPPGRGRRSGREDHSEQ